MIYVSTGLIDHMLVTNSFKNAMEGAFPKIYGGSIPANADAALGGASLLWDLPAIAWAASASGRTLSKDATELNAAASATGTGTFFRLVQSGDTGASSTTEKRLQGTVGVAAPGTFPDMTLDSVSFTATVTPTNGLNYWIFAAGACGEAASTGLIQHLLVTGSLKNALDLGFLKFYSGPVPSGPDAALDGADVELVTITVNGDGVTGLTWDGTPVGGALVKNSDTWQGTVIPAGGTVSFARYVLTGDTGGASTTEKRLQWTVGLPGSGADIEIGDTNLTGSSVLPVNTMTIPILPQCTG